jgi:hypothetical protein
MASSEIESVIGSIGSFSQDETNELFKVLLEQHLADPFHRMGDCQLCNPSHVYYLCEGCRVINKDYESVRRAVCVECKDKFYVCTNPWDHCEERIMQTFSCTIKCHKYKRMGICNWCAIDMSESIKCKVCKECTLQNKYCHNFTRGATYQS